MSNIDNKYTKAINKKPRIDYIDLAKGFCICLVVYHHYCYQFTAQDSNINFALISFRMPLYFILSGLFFKDYGGLWNFTKQKTNKILIPFIFFAGINSLLVALVRFIKNKPVSLEPLYSLYSEHIPNYPTWFLWCLFINGIIFYFIYLASKPFKKYMPFAIATLSIVIGCIGFTLGKQNINLPFYFDSALTATPFYAFGYMLRKYTNFLYPNKSDKYIIPITIVCFVYILLFASRQSYIENNMQEANIFFVYSCGIIGTIGILSLSKMIKKLPIISYLGRYSIMILCTHILFYQFIFKYIVTYCHKSLDIPKIYTAFACFVAVCLLYMLIIPFMRKFMPYVCAQKDLIKT